ncbi:MAG: ADP-ribosylglycohydrolase family protein [Chloroflexi bacterium]|nr:ADP-ribosylglycohydrolase family protein [Chloroflexota bacterium]MYC47042.1 ADP-ribosylglycohydrolase family protein [Chloroflexota bacterium]
MGLASGDALGTALEFSAPGDFNPIKDMVGGGPYGLIAGQWTDDTSMALCLASSLLESGGFDLEDQMQRYVRWWRQGYFSSTGRCFDIGVTVSNALSRFEANGNPIAGSRDALSAGNGSLMRLAPVPMYYAGEPELAIKRAAESSRTTHQATEALDACRYFAGLLVSALRGASRTKLLSAMHCPAPGAWSREPLAPAIARIARGSFKYRNPPEIVGSGYVVQSLEAALWAFYHAKDFKDGALLAANLGNDADTTAAIYGQIAGAHFGVSAIPNSWRRRLTQSKTIMAMSDKLFRRQASIRTS